MSAVKDLAISILDQVDLNVARVGIVTFSASSQTLVPSLLSTSGPSSQISMPLSANRAALTASIRSIFAHGDTYISDGLLSGVTLLRNATSRVSSSTPDMIWLLTDGVQSSQLGDRTAIETAAAIKANGTTIYEYQIFFNEPEAYDDMCDESLTNPDETHSLAEHG